MTWHTKGALRWSVRKTWTSTNVTAAIVLAVVRESAANVSRTICAAGNCRHAVSRMTWKGLTIVPLKNSLNWLTLAECSDPDYGLAVSKSPSRQASFPTFLSAFLFGWFSYRISCDGFPKGVKKASVINSAGESSATHPVDPIRQRHYR